MPGVSVGERFYSLADLEIRIQQYQDENFVQLTLRDTRTLENATKRAPKRAEGANKELRYYSMHYTCVRGGKKYKCLSLGLRRRQGTMKQECKAGIKLCLSDDKQHLVVTDVNEEHNHAVSKEIYSLLPKQRRLDDADKEDVEAMISLGVNKKLIQLHVQQTTGKAVTLKDLSNIQAQRRDKVTRSDLTAAVKQLHELQGSTVEIFTSDDETLTAIYFQEAEMKANFCPCAEVLTVQLTNLLI